MTTKRYSYRAYPTGEQAQALARLFGCVRVVYNDYVAERERLYHEGTHRAVKPGETAKKVTTLAKATTEREWLSEVSAVPLQQAAADAQGAFSNWFKSLTGQRKGPKLSKPVFKRRGNRQAARFTKNARFKVRAVPEQKWGWVTLPGVGDVKFRLSRGMPAEPSSVTVVHEPDGTYHLSFVVAVPERELVPEEHPGRVAGLDAGIGDDLLAAVYSDGTREKVENPRHLRKKLRKLRKEQKRLSRMVKGSRNWGKQRQRVAKTHARVAQTRLDHHRKLARKLAAENETVCIEDLSLKGMGRTRLAKSVHDAGLGLLFRLLAETADTQGRRVEKSGRWEPTTQTCSVCGTPGGKKPLNVRQWTCEGCGTLLDRDWNAAVNVIVAAGLAHCLDRVTGRDAVDALEEGGETLNACGGNVRRGLARAIPREAGTRRTSHVLAA